MMGTSQPGVVTIRAGQDSRNRLFTLIHELVHQTWHHQLDEPTSTRAQLEFEAESVAFVVASVMNLEHPSARDYLLSYEVTPRQLKASLAVIQVMVRQVLKVLELPFEVVDHPAALAD
jgi:Zn-dependent peptidase ImmA (M78 family)